MTETYQIFVGIDWGSEAHQVWVSDAAGAYLGERVVPHTGADLTALAAWLVTRAGGDAATVAVAIEIPHGPIVDTLLEHGCQVWAINPKQLDRFRDRFCAAGAKDDRRDARVLSSALRTDPVAFRHLAVDDPRRYSCGNTLAMTPSSAKTSGGSPIACVSNCSGPGRNYCSGCPRPMSDGCGRC